jgi:signal transduction histidine kinase
MSAISSRARELLLPAGAMPRPRAGLLVDVSLAVFIVAMIGLMVRLPGHEAAPFHFIFLALALAYGYRLWPVVPTVTLILTISLMSGWLMVSHANDGLMAKAELAEIPLLPLVLLAMVWHAQRRVTAMRLVEEMARRQQAGLAQEREREREFFRDASHAIRTPVTIARR